MRPTGHTSPRGSLSVQVTIIWNHAIILDVHHYGRIRKALALQIMSLERGPLRVPLNLPPSSLGPPTFGRCILARQRRSRSLMLELAPAANSSVSALIRKFQAYGRAHHRSRAALHDCLTEHERPSTARNERDGYGLELLLSMKM